MLGRYYPLRRPKTFSEKVVVFLRAAEASPRRLESRLKKLGAGHEGFAGPNG
jgi:hypothetical protein